MSDERIASLATGQDDTEKAGKDGVSASAITPPKGGKWLPGQSGNPLGRNFKKQADITRALADGIPVHEVIDTVAGLIRDTSSWRAREAGVKLYLSYMFGTPIQRSVTASTKLESILAQVTELSDDEFADVEQKLREG